MPEYVFGNVDQRAWKALTYGSLERSQSSELMKKDALAEVCATIETNGFRLSSDVSVSKSPSEG